MLDFDSLEIAVSNLDHAPLEVPLFFRRVDFAKLVFAFLEVVIEVVLPGTRGFLAQEIALNRVVNAFLFKPSNLAKAILLLPVLLKRSLRFISPWPWRFLGQDHCLLLVMKPVILRNVRPSFA